MANCPFTLPSLSIELTTALATSFKAVNPAKRTESESSRMAVI